VNTKVASFELVHFMSELYSSRICNNWLLSKIRQLPSPVNYIAQGSESIINLRI